MIFFETIKKNKSTRYKICSITVLKKVNKKYETKIYLLGIKIYHQKKYLKYLRDIERQMVNNREMIIKTSTEFARIPMPAVLNQLDHINCLLEQAEFADLKQHVDINNSVAAIHKDSFSPYHKKFQGQDIVIVGSGPTLNNYQPIEGAIHIALNRSCKFDKVKFDFIFIQDIHGLKEDIGFINNYPEPCQKFYGYIPKHQCSIPEKDAMMANAKRFYTGGRITPFYPDIAHCVLPDYGSIAFSALAFALYTHPQRIYLVGCDVSSGYFFDADKNADFVNYPDPVLLGWQHFKEFVELYYPDVEIVSVNPVTLKGMFNDSFQSLST